MGSGYGRALVACWLMFVWEGRREWDRDHTVKSRNEVKKYTHCNARLRSLRWEAYTNIQNKHASIQLLSNGVGVGVGMVGGWKTRNVNGAWLDIVESWSLTGVCVDDMRGGDKDNEVKP